MKQIQCTPSGGGLVKWFGRTDVRDPRAEICQSANLFLQAIASISNGILRDERVFHVDSDDWFKKYNLQGRYRLLCVDLSCTNLFPRALSS